MEIESLKEAVSKMEDPRQIWHFIWDSGKSAYKIVNAYSGRLIDVYNGSFAAGTNVQGHDQDNGGIAQRWILESIGRDSEKVFKLAAMSGNLRMDLVDASATPGNNIQLYYNNNNNDSWAQAQKFKIIPISAPGGQLTRLTYLSNGSSFYARIGFKDAAYVQTTGTYNYNSSGEGSMNVNLTSSKSDDPRQIWHFERQSDGSYKIKNEYNGWYLDVQGGWTSNTNNVWTWYQSHSNPAERWYPMYSPTDGAYRIASALLYPWTVDGYHTLRSMDVERGLTDSGTNVQIYEQHDGDSQQFSIVPEDFYTKPPAPAVPENIYINGPPESVLIRWSSVPEQNRYDSREYQIILRDSNGGVMKSWRQTGTSYTYQNLPVGQYSVSVRAINAKYPDSSSNYCSAYSTQAFSVSVPNYITLSASPAGCGAVSGAGTCIDGERILIQAIPNSGYRFVEWMDENGSTYSTEAEFWYTAAGDLTLTAVFEPEAPAPKPTYTINITSNSPGWGAVSGGGNYEEGARVTIVASPDSGYRFVEWRLNGRQISTSPSYQFTVSQSQTFTAIFEKQVDTIHGKVTIDALFTPYSPAGEIVTIRVTPDAGYQLNSIRVVGPNGQTAALSGVGNIYSFTMPAFDVEVYADYVKK